MFFVTLFNIIFAMTQTNPKYFKQYQKNIIPLTLPHHIVCGKSTDPNSTIDRHLLNKFGPSTKQDVEVIGELFNGGSYVYILYSVKSNPVDPWMYIYKKDGKKIDSLYLHHGYCFSDSDGDKTVSALVDIDKSITITDSIISYRFDSIAGRTLDFTLVSRSIYKPDSKKLFKLFSQQSDTLFAEKK